MSPRILPPERVEEGSTGRIRGSDHTDGQDSHLEALLAEHGAEGLDECTFTGTWGTSDTDTEGAGNKFVWMFLGVDVSSGLQDVVEKDFGLGDVFGVVGFH